MNTQTGAIYDTGSQAYFDAVQRGEPLVPVSGQVAQMVKVGKRELDRRKRRAAKQARKRNR